MVARGEIYRGLALAVILSTVLAMAVAPTLQQVSAGDDVSIAMKTKKKSTLVSVKNSGDEPIYAFKIMFDDSNVRYAKAKGWEREKIDPATIQVMTTDKPLQPGRSLIVILVVDKQDAPYAWSAMDASGLQVASGGTMGMTETAMVTPQPEPEPQKEEKKPGTFQPTPLSSAVTLNGAGATFPFPLLDKWRVEYAKVNDKVTINYQSIGSGGGVKQFIAKTVDFGASDAPLTTEQFKTLKQPIHYPETIGAVTVTYNLPGLDGKPIGSGLKMTPDIVADIFLGKLKKWNDVRIAVLNPEALLPEENIIVAHRSDGSGTTFVFTDYLSTVSSEWDEKVGKDKAVQWPTGVGATGNEGVAGVVRSTAYSVGYVELAYATQTGMSVAALQNREGEFIIPTLESTKIAAASAATGLPKPDEDWSKVSIVNAPGKGSYPIASFTYLLLYTNFGEITGMTQERGQALADFMYWAVTDGQLFAGDLQYVPLPDEVVLMNIEALRGLHLNGTPFNIPS
jgi:phosphate transport system permease protein/phosphate transport system substrate-binding protein